MVGNVNSSFSDMSKPRHCPEGYKQVEGISWTTCLTCSIYVHVNWNCRTGHGGRHRGGQMGQKWPWKTVKTSSESAALPCSTVRPLPVQCQ